LSADWLSRIGALLARQAFRRVRTRLNPDDIGGAPLLGVNGVVVIGHGSASPQAILGSINQARKAVQGKTVETIQAGMAKYRR
ncbi:MAG: phosphate--acyl-ACP acyltransferase, partial [Aggregatilineales bacterium]